MTTSSKKAIYAGTFDPFTYGHNDILERSLTLFDEVTILIAVSPTKKPMFSEKQRVEMISELFKDNPRVKVDSWGGLLVDYAKQKEISCIVRGLRPTGDFEVEFQMASMNRRLNPEIETVFLTTGIDNYFVSSSLIKELYHHGRDVSKFLPEEILKHMKK